MNPTLTARNASHPENLSPTERNLRRRLIFQDSLALLSLTAIAICMAVLTYFFFRSFQEHRQVLEKRWFARGQKSLAAGHPGPAVEDFRSALSLSTANPTYEMALAQALAAAGHTEEAYVYFSSLRDAQPGDGFLNLQLARLAVRRKNPAQAIGFYQSALNGLWYGHGTRRRLEIRLELSKYLISLDKPTDAQGELLAAEGNSLDQPSAIFEIAGLLEEAADPSDAWTAYQRVERDRNASPTQIQQSLFKEAQIAMSMGQYKRAALALDRYSSKLRQHPSASAPEEKRTAQQQSVRLQRMLQLIPFYGLSPRQHQQRILLGASIAHQRYVRCQEQLRPQPDSSLDGTAPDHSKFFALGTQWTQMGQLKPANLAGNAPLQQTLITWTNQTELLTALLCGPPTGDDALLLQLAQTPDKTE